MERTLVADVHSICFTVCFVDFYGWIELKTSFRVHVCYPLYLSFFFILLFALAHQIVLPETVPSELSHEETSTVGFLLVVPLILSSSIL